MSTSNLLGMGTLELMPKDQIRKYNEKWIKYANLAIGKLINVVLGICLGLSIMTSTFAYEDGDWQFWNTESIEGNLAENCKVKLEEEFRFGDNIGELYYHHTDGGLSYKVTDGLSLGLNHRQIYKRKNCFGILPSLPLYWL